MASPSSALPTSRTFITQLFDSLSTLPSDQAAAATNDNAKTNTNPLNNLSDETRKQLLSLQVVFPTEFVPALDLLDRRLVTRFHIRNEEQMAELKTVVDAGDRQQDVHMMQDTTAESEAPPPQQQQQQQQENAHARTTPATPKEADPTDKDKINDLNNNNTIYYVRSAQQQRSSRFATSYDTTTYYQVRLRAWNCSCPAFAFSAFPATTVTTRHVENEEEAAEVAVHTPLHNNNSTTHQEVNNNKDSNNNNADNKWIFGGISLVGKETTPPPVCKHLLACVFVERCNGLFGGFVEDREVSVEEAAGWAAGWGD
ncbi:unnamed protein product [Alternaria alternata]|uniref:SWIM-type domain-containing protein n=1 Tax=Alternaria alternata TaxID=5599 RepID=A0A4Q4N417_ALTAL|nr:hypothetical protein AA0117_g10574 [Alternaria alternata]